MDSVNKDVIGDIVGKWGRIVTVGRARISQTAAKHAGSIVAIFAAVCNLPSFIAQSFGTGTGSRKSE